MEVVTVVAVITLFQSSIILLLWYFRNRRCGDVQRDIDRLEDRLNQVTIIPMSSNKESSSAPYKQRVNELEFEVKRLQLENHKLERKLAERIRSDAIHNKLRHITKRDDSDDTGDDTSGASAG